mgnify:FL=1
MIEIPSNPDAELSVLGCLLVDERVADTVFEALLGPEFYADIHRKLFGIIKRVHEKTHTVDIVDVENECHKVGLDTAITRQAVEQVPTSANVERYIQIGQEYKVKRDVYNFSKTLASKIEDGDADDLAEWSEREVAKIQASRIGITDEPKCMAEIAIKIATEAIEEPERSSIGYKIDLANGALSELICLEPNKQVLIAGRTYMGKSTLAAAIYRNVIECNSDIGDPLYITTEGGQDCIVRSVIGSMSKIHPKKITKRGLTQVEADNLWSAATNTNLNRMFIDYLPGRTIAQLRAVCKRHKSQHGLPLLIIDLADKISAPGDKEYERLSYISRALFELKAELNTCLVATVQIGRGALMNAGKIPTLGDLKGTGSWEQDADRIILVHYPAYYGDKKDHTTHIIQAKDRDFGDTRTVRVEYKKAWGTYHKADQKMEDGE